MDMEAGLEHLGRGTADSMDRFIVVVEPGARSIQTYQQIKKLAGDNSHHIVEGAFKSAARSLRAACAIDPTLNGAIPSTKGVL